MPENARYWLRRAYAKANEVGLTREERHELAEMLLKHDVTTWKGLDDPQLAAIVTALDGYHYVSTLLAQRAPKPQLAGFYAPIVPLYPLAVWSPDLPVAAGGEAGVLDGEDDAG